MDDPKPDEAFSVNKANMILKLLTQFPFSQIKERTQLYFCDGFKLTSGLFISEEDPEVKEAVYLLEINYFDETLVTNEDILPVLELLVKNEKSPNPYMLERKGIYYDVDLNIMHFIYKADNKKLFIEESIFNLLQQDDNSKNILKLQVFYNYLQIVKAEHSGKQAMSLIHPFLIFCDNYSVYTIDNAFALLRPCINSYSNVSILSYFGVFDIDLLDKLEASKEEKSELYLKPDILLLCALLVYLYRPMITKVSFNFDLILNEISKDFIYRDEGKRLVQMTNSIKDNENIKRICSSVLSIDYNEISNIERLIKQVMKHFANVYLLNLQCNCDISLLLKESAPMLSLICFNCGLMQCPKCNKDQSHSCQTDQNKTQRLKQTLKAEYEVKMLSFDNIPEMKEKRIIESFSDTIKKLYAEFEDKNDVSVRKIKMIEHFIENFTNYVEKKITSYDETKFDELKKEIQLLKDTGNSNLRSSSSVLTNKLFMRIHSNKTIKNEEIRNLKDKWDMLSKEIEEFSSFIKDSRDMLNVLLYDRSIQLITQVAKARMQEFQMLINEDFFDDYESGVKEVIESITRICTNNGDSPLRSDHILNEYLLTLHPSKRFNYEKYFVFYSDKIALYSVKAKKETEVKLEMSDNSDMKPISVGILGKNYRYLHLKTGVMITGGKGIRKVYMINYTEIRENVHLVNPLPDLEEIHEKHMMISFNTFNVIVIGGIDSAKCEMYNFAFRKWESLPSLSAPRFDACVFLFNGHLIYVFGGMSDLEAFSNRIEVLDMNHIGEKWVTKDFLYGENSIREFRLCGIRKKEDEANCVLIFGGETTIGNTFEAIELVQKFNFESCTLSIVNQNSKPYSYEECLLLETAPNEYNIQQ